MQMITPLILGILGSLTFATVEEKSANVSVRFTEPTTILTPPTKTA